MCFDCDLDLPYECTGLLCKARVCTDMPSFPNCINCATAEWCKNPPKLERQTSASIDLGSGVGLSYPLNTKKVTLLKRGQVYPVALPGSVTEIHELADGKESMETTATRTAIGMEPLEFLLDEFPDGIRETIVKIIDK